MAIFQDIINFGMQHQDLLKQIESMALDECMVLIKQIAPSHPLFVQIAQKIVDLIQSQVKPS